MPLDPGTRLGIYEIQSLIGAGGMGEVYRATDSRLHRAIAIKVVPSAVGDDSQLRERFEREARATASLNHPNIVTIHSVEQAEGRHFITMELVEGRTLGQMLGRQGLPTIKLLEVAVPLADAVAAAHQRGITHRDLKPANVMVTSDGRVKVLDFGLAKQFDTGLPSVDNSTFATGHLTGQGSIVGTVAYMSPEQAEAKAVDHRTDLFSLGVVLYEMATGVRPFHGDTSLSLLSSIVRDTPRLADDVNGGVPRELARIIRRCLAKDAEDRYQSAKDLRNELRELKRDIESGEIERPPVAAARARLSALPWIIGGAALLVGGAAVAWVALGPPATETGSVEATFTQLTFDAGPETFPSVSPDGKWIVYSRASAPGNADIYLQSVGGRNAINLTADSAAPDSAPSFSPDGDSIAFYSARQGGGVFVMGRTGEFARKVTVGFSPAWSPDGKQLVVSSVNAAGTPYGRSDVGELWIADVATGARRLVYKGDAVQPHWSPHGHRIAFWGLRARGSQRDIWTISATGGEPVSVTDDAPLDWSPVWSADGRYVYFSSDRSGSLNLWRTPIDERSGRTLGQPQAVTTPSLFAGHLSVSRAGDRLVYVNFNRASNIERFELDPSTGEINTRGTPLTTGSTYADEADVSWDGQQIVFRAGLSQEDLFIRRVDGTGLRQLTSDRPRDRYPRWSPNGRQIIFYSDRSGSYELWMIEADGTGMRPVTQPGETASASPGVTAWAPDGKTVAGTNARDFRTTTLFDPLKPWREQKPELLPPHGSPPRVFVVSAWSPDGSRILGSGNSSGPIVTYDITARRYTELTTRAGANDAYWLGDTGSVVFRAGRDKVLLFDAKTRQTRELLSVSPDVVTTLALSRDGRQLFLTRAANEADIWLATLKAPAQ